MNAPGPPVAGQINEVARGLASGLHALLGTGPQRSLGGLEIERRYGLNRVVSHRISSALRRADPVASMHQLPGPEPLRRLLRAAEEGGADPLAVRAAAEAVDRFEALIRTVGGDRSGLDAIVSTWVPEARARFESEAKQMVFRGMRQLKGLAADVMLTTSLLHPSEDPQRLDLAVVQGYYGLRCLRPGSRHKLGVRSATAHAAGDPPRTLAGIPVRDEPRGVLLDRYCRGSPAGLEAQGIGSDLVYTLSWGEDVGMGAPRDVVLATVHPRGPRRWRSPDDARPRASLCNAINVPSRLYISDVLLHRDAYPEWAMNVRVLETGEAGRAMANDPSRDLDVVDLLESIEPLGTGVGRCRIEGVPDYPDLLAHVAASLGWDPSAFRAYRARIEYPVFATQVQHLIDVPVGSAAG